jgi:hypothetical protein
MSNPNTAKLVTERDELKAELVEKQKYILFLEAEVMLATVRGLPLPVSQRDDGAAIESLAVLGCMFNNEKGGWQWVQLSPGFKELIGDIMMENHFQRDVWHSMKLHREGDREVVKALGKHGEEEEA